MTGIVAVVFAFLTFGKARNTARLSERGESVRSAAQKLVRIALMSHVEHDLIVGKVENVKERDRRFHRAEIRGKVAAAFHDRFIDDPSEFVA